MKRFSGEFMGTFTMVFIGTGAIVMDQHTSGAVSNIGIALAFGLAVASMILAFGRISGAHLNPAVTLAFALTKRFSKRDLFPYFLAQAAGAILAGFMLKALFPDSELLGNTLPSGPAWQSLFLEMLLTFILVYVILQASHAWEGKVVKVAAVVGTVIFLEAWLAGPVSGASMNPARSLGPAFASGHLHYLWIYLTAPFCGAVLAAWLWSSRNAPKTPGS